MTSSGQPAELERARRQMMTGVMLVMGACVFGGLTAVVLMVMQQRTGAGIVAAAAGLLIIAGIVIQAGAMKKLKAGSAPKGGSQ